MGSICVRRGGKEKEHMHKKPFQRLTVGQGAKTGEIEKKDKRLSVKHLYIAFYL